MNVSVGFATSLVGLFFALQAVALVIIVARLVKTRLWAPACSLVSREEVPEKALMVLDAAASLLESRGFRAMYFRRCRWIVASEFAAPCFGVVYHHPELDVYAEARVAVSPHPARPFDIFLINACQDGRMVVTASGIAHSGIPLEFAGPINDTYASDFTEQLNSHIDAREGLPTQTVGSAEFASMLERQAADLLPGMEKQGIVYRRDTVNGEAVYGLRLWPAIKRAWRTRSGLGRRRKLEAQLKAQLKAQQAHPPEVVAAAEEIALAKALSFLYALQAPRWFRYFGFVASALAFACLGGWWWGAEATLAIGVVIAFHEAGHWLAMRLAKFRDVHVFFVPGMGAATVGEKHDAGPLTHLAVYLAGPVPGVLLGLGMMAWLVLGPAMPAAYSKALSGLAVVTLLLNFMNLAPMMPFDGGRIVDLFVMTRWPWLRFVFVVGSSAALLWFGVSWGDGVLKGLGLLLLFLSFHYYRVAKMSAELLRRGRLSIGMQRDFDAIAAEMCDVWRDPRYGKWPFKVKLNVGVALTPRLLGRLPRKREMAAGLLIYIACLTLPVFAAAGLFAAAPEKALVALGQGFAGRSKDAPPSTPQARRDAELKWRAELEKARRDREAGIDEAKTPVDRLSALYASLTEADDVEDYADALRLSRAYYAEASRDAPQSIDHARAAQMLAEHLMYEDKSTRDAKAADKREQLLEEAEGILRRLLAKGGDDAGQMLAELLEYRAASMKDGGGLAQREEIVRLYQAHLNPPDYRLRNAWLRLAESLDRNGRTDEAEKALMSAEAVQADIAKGRKPMRAADDLARPLISHAWFLLAHRRPDDAARLIAPLLDTSLSGAGLTAWRSDEAHLIAALAARMRGDWPLAKTHALAMGVRGADEASKRQGWFWRWVVKTIRKEPPRELRSSLLLIEAERALGEDDQAEKLAGELKARYRSMPGKTMNCRLFAVDHNWYATAIMPLQAEEQHLTGCRLPNWMTQ